MSIVGKVILPKENKAVEQSERLFDAPWQAQIFSLVVSLQEQGIIGLTEWNSVVSEALNGSCAGNDAYYEAWTRALEKLLIKKELLAPLQLTQQRMAWRLAAEKTPHGQAIAEPRKVFN
jgi:nitrile hydratase accessory protein